MNVYKYLMASLLILISTQNHATLGGDQSIEILGFEVKEQKLYVLRHFVDERGRLPQLYYYQLNSKTPDKLIEVKSLYIHPQTKQIDYDQDHVLFEKNLDKIKKHLIPLVKENIQYTRIKKIENKVYEVPAWHTLSEKIPLYITTYKVHSGNFQSSHQTALNYDNQVKIIQSYDIPNQYKMIVIVKYLGIPLETGYSIEEPVLLLPKK